MAASSLWLTTMQTKHNQLITMTIIDIELINFEFINWMLAIKLSFTSIFSVYIVNFEFSCTFTHQISEDDIFLVSKLNYMVRTLFTNYSL